MSSQNLKYGLVLFFSVLYAGMAALLAAGAGFLVGSACEAILAVYGVTPAFILASASGLIAFVVALVIILGDDTV